MTGSFTRSPFWRGEECVKPSRRRGNALADEVYNGLGRGPRKKNFGDAYFLEVGNVGFGDDAADQDGDVGHALGMQEFHQAGAERVVRAGKNREADDVNVFLHGGRGDHFGRLAQARVDHFHTGVAERAGDHFGAAVVAVEARLGDQDAYLLLRHLVAVSLWTLCLLSGLCVSAFRALQSESVSANTVFEYRHIEVYQQAKPAARESQIS